MHRSLNPLATVRPPRARLALPLLLCTVLPTTAAPAQTPQPTDRPLLWVIEGKAPVYLFGTIHIPDDRVLALPDVVETAIDESDAFYAELPMDLPSMMGAASKMMLPAQTSLKDKLPPDLYARLSKLVSKHGLPMVQFDRMQVWAVASQVPMLKYAQKMMTTQPLDMQLYMRAMNDGQEVGGLETIDEQIGVFGSLSDAEQVQFLKDSLDELEQGEKTGDDPLEKLVKAYLAGDPDKLMKLMNEYLVERDTPMYNRLFKKLITDRNHVMAERIVDKLKQHPDRRYVFAVGAAHLPGDEGVLTLLEKQGYKVRRVKAGEKLPPNPN